MNFEGDVDYILDFDSDGDEEDIDISSEDEIDILLHGNDEKRKQLMNRRSSNSGQKKIDSSSEDEFEKQMSSELKSTMQLVEAAHNRSFSESNTKTDQPSTSGASENKAQKHKLPEYYDDAYFDSDSDEENTREEKKKIKRKVMSNDELLYDPEMDDEDQQWVDNQRRTMRGRSKSSKHVKQRGDKLPSSDAVLNCPACMVTLCRDCQRHEVYQNQYRAMFVTNCKVLRDEVLRFPKGNKDNKKHRKKTRKSNKTAESNDGSADQADGMETKDSDTTVNADNSEVYNPVKCEQCNTEVGVFDKEEVYHFFNVLTSYG